MGIEYELGGLNAKLAAVLEGDTIRITLTNLGTDVTVTGDFLVDTLGALNDAKVVNPDAASATLPALARGQLKQLVDIVAALGVANGHLSTIATNTTPA